MTEAIRPKTRIAAIDVFRALTMLCMIFVNDLWTLTGVPHWLEHAAANEDFLGFSDLVFPAFLFALGLSIPFAIDNRLRRGESVLKIVAHIMLRSAALLIMGIFIVNKEAGISAATGLSPDVFTLLMVGGFFLVWNVYPKAEGKKKYLYVGLQVLGILLLAYLAFIYRDAAGNRMGTRWWGILGLIGWTYLVCALIYLAFRKRFFAHLIAMFAFIMLCVAGASGWLGTFNGRIVSNGAFHVFTMAGLSVSLLFAKYPDRLPLNKIFATLLSAGCLFIAAGFISRNFWIISKISATPTWVFFCTGISIIFYTFIYLLVQTGGKEHWFKIIEPAGTATLTCYLVPYLLYIAISRGLQLFDTSLPDFMVKCPAGLLKSVAFALLAIGVTALLGKIRIKLKI